ncbi:MAG: DNA polymerase III subunit gamma/tau [Ardenticatenaceae bacterium]|nr:DNA polymerase III subunit gamma/tau [Ardenticatenaceae bacterium]
MSQALYRKWRPARFNDVIGQEHVTRTLQNSVAAGRVGHAYLFCGPRGTGKTTSARLVAKAVNCLHEDVAQRPCNTCEICKSIGDGRFLDLIEIDAASNTGVDDIRDLRDKINFAPSQGRFKVYIIDEVHMLSTAAFNALLKTLEEPPAHAMFVLATTEEHKVPMTIKSRCQQFNFRLLTVTEIKERLQWLADQEGLTIEPDALTLIARQGAGSIRDAESLLDQLVTVPGDTITLERAQMVLGTATDTAVTELTAAWLKADGAAGLNIIHDALTSGTDARQFCRQMVAYLRQLLLLQAAGDQLDFEGTSEQKADMVQQAQRASRQMLIDAVKMFNEAALTPANSWQPQLPLELAFVQLLPDAPMPMVTVPVKTAPTPVKTAESPPPDPQTTTPPDPPTHSPPPPVAKVRETAVIPLSIDQVTGHWQAMLDNVSQANKNLPPLLAMSKPLAIENETIVLGFDYPIFRDKFNNTADAAAVIGDAYTHLLGRKCTVRSVVTSEYNVAISKDEFQALADELGGVVRD